MRANHLPCLATLVVIVVGPAGCAGGPPLELPPAPTVVVVPRPTNCRSVTVGSSLATALSNAAQGDVLCLEPGTYVGRVTVPVGVTLWGGPEAVIKTDGSGTTVSLLGKTTLLGLTVDGSGGRFDVVDAAVRVNGEDIRVEGITIRNSVFGILAEKSKRVTIRSNHIIGTGGPAFGLRGDGIRLWETYNSLVEHNRVQDARDCVVWYSSDNMLRGNEVRDGRYGVHFMYSHRNSVVGNRFLANEVGTFVMYSRDLLLEGNAVLSSHGAASMGFGLKESGNVTVRNNLILHNATGLFLDNSPLNPGDKNLFEGNVLRLSETAVGFLASQKDNLFRRNSFRDNTIQVRVDGGGDAMGVTWEENEWDDYVGFDLDGDGQGDVPYELNDLADAMEARHAELGFLRGTPALALVSLVGHVAPLFAPKPVLRDPRPLMNFANGVQLAN